ncbi:MAG: hypothetical protein AB7F43_14725 [Bacteriovoracia bacterium]
MPILLLALSFFGHFSFSAENSVVDQIRIHSEKAWEQLDLINAEMKAGDSLGGLGAWAELCGADENTSPDSICKNISSEILSKEKIANSLEIAINEYGAAKKLIDGNPDTGIKDTGAFFSAAAGVFQWFNSFSFFDQLDLSIGILSSELGELEKNQGLSEEDRKECQALLQTVLGYKEKHKAIIEKFHELEKRLLDVSGRGQGRNRVLPFDVDPSFM